ncbi:hypothetical protein MesoLjLc_18130 [Mesorhizobium sp. L-8-10]|uniref:nuclear transport factor 2 family protein n=1 Tax=Mesorhizobium sp. L-8-10 TaxID=2744523 RepID=UPI0019253A5A|nr:nuclear transport factor 2 family protein [Mesorhizobium sp. L-8-10]BCH29883.1 hypothetical protein MesoLjLc_18130 [Mesorhizobium sp. L-8-10]
MKDFERIETLMDEYFRVLHEGDVDATKAMFMPNCHLFAPQSDGSVTVLDLEAYVKLVASRKSPKDAGYPRYGRVVSIDQSSDNTAFVKVECAVQPRYFVDYLTLVKENDRWRIAAKIYCVTKVQE